ncbi:hypothetical protein C0J52_18446 [Blattella germanica]|nr:hypothetical protein C0J52_18446 [Blattella germanica]
MYKACVELWDVKSPGYKSRNKKINSTKELARHFQTTPAEITRKLHNMRSQMCHELKKIHLKKGEKTEDSSYDGNESGADEPSSSGKPVENRNKRKRELGEESSENNAYITPNCLEGTPEPEAQEVSPRTRSKLSEVQCVINELKGISDTLHEDDELHAFGRSILTQMRKLPEAYVVDLMCEIQNLVARKRIQYLQDCAQNK